LNNLLKITLSLALSFCLIFQPVLTALSENGSVLPKSRVGFAYLPLLHPNFPVSDAIEVLKNSRDKLFSVAYGPFGRSAKNFHKVMKEVPNSSVMIYGLCGPCRVPRRDGKMEQFRRDLSIPDLNRQLVTNKNVQLALKAYYTKIKINFIDPYPNTQFEFVPELESNLSVKAESVAINIYYEVFAGSDNVSLRLNPLKQRRLGKIPTEVHNITPTYLNFIKPGDSVSLDGIYPSKDLIKKTILALKPRHIDFYIWKPEWQGIDPKRTTNPPPDRRTYVILNKPALIAYSKL